MNPVFQRWAPTVAVGATLTFLGIWEVLGDHFYSGVSQSNQVLFAVIFALTVATYRMLPGLGLGLLWLLVFVQFWADVPILFTQLGVGALAYGCARYGSVITVVASAVSAPAFGLLVALFVAAASLPSSNSIYYEIVGAGSGSYSLGAALILGGAVLIVPWLLGLLLRVLRREAVTRAQQVETAAERDQAAELAEVREGQARLARDVHDVVGHSLAVILAQAESAQYLPDEDPARLKATLATIATSARTSLQDVRHVLGATGDRPPRGDLDTLIDGVRASGHEVLSSEVGDPRPMPPELATVAYRVLQEMLTNAIRHGRRDEPVHVERHWQDELRIEVSNVVDTSTAETMRLQVAALDPAPAVATPEPGHGLQGMRRRLESVGGRLDVRPRSGPGAPTFTVTAWVPVGAR